MASKSAAVALLNPFHDPEPSEDTGLNSNLSTQSVQPSSPVHQPSTPPRTSLGSNNPFREGSIKRQSPQAGSPSHRSPTLDAPFGTLASPRQRASSNGTKPPNQESPSSQYKSHHRRTSSLKQRYPGDNSHEPLNIIRRDSRKADRSPHLRKHHQPGPDLIDRLDPAVGGRAYHHEGPFDAALLARNSSFESSPIAALKTSIEETLKATPQEKIDDAVQRHRPLDGTAIVPSGQTDEFGHEYHYKEGADLLHEPSEDDPGYKRYGEKDYDPADLKGKGEPQFSLDQAFKDHKIDERGIEMQERERMIKDQRGSEVSTATDSDIKRTGSLRAAGNSLKKRIGSLRHKKTSD